MRTSDASIMSTLCLTWINNELRKEIERREQAVVVLPSMTRRMMGSIAKTKTLTIAMLTGVPAIVARVFGL